MLRRALALGAALIVLIGSCSGSRAASTRRRAAHSASYARNVSQIVEETQQTSKAFFGKLSNPGSLSVTEFVAEVNADRSAMDNYVTRVDSLSAPGGMGEAQSALELVYELRGSAMDEIANKMSTALGNVGAAKATAVIAKQMQKLLASDVLYAAVARPEIDGGARKQRDRRQQRAAERLPAGRDEVARPGDGQLGAWPGQRLDRSGDAGRPRSGAGRRQRSTAPN